MNPTATPQPLIDVPGDSLSSGAAGAALLHIERARTSTGRWATAHHWATQMTRHPVNAHPDTASLYRGAPAAAYVLHTADHPAYAPGLAVLDDHVTAVARHRLNRAHDRIDRQQLPALREYDLISGLTGIGTYLLLRRDRHPDLLHEVLAYLVRLTEPLHHDGQRLPGWWCANSPNDQPARDWPGGHGNLGVAHGIAGPLALLATATRRGHRCAGQAEATDRICTWLDRWRIGSGTAAWWPGRISRTELAHGQLAQRGPQRPSWCYGTPGIARAQQLGTLALDDPHRQRAAENALTGAVTDAQQLAHLHDASLCHGWAGLVLTTWRAAADASSDALPVALPRLRACFAQQVAHVEFADAGGLLEGDAGVQLIDHTLTLDQPATTWWDACLLTTG
jgi:lantibiotic biosynthesis protein